MEQEQDAQRIDAARVLEESADALESGRLKWIQGNFQVGENPNMTALETEDVAEVCALGAVELFWAQQLGLRRGERRGSYTNDVAWLHFEDDDVRGRAAGALNHVLGFPPAGTPNSRGVICSDGCPECVSHVETNVADWNDNPKRTMPEVVDAMKQAAKFLRNGEQQ